MLLKYLSRIQDEKKIYWKINQEEEKTGKSFSSGFAERKI